MAYINKKAYLFRCVLQGMPTTPLVRSKYRLFEFQSFDPSRPAPLNYIDIHSFNTKPDAKIVLSLHPQTFDNTLIENRYWIYNPLENIQVHIENSIPFSKLLIGMQLNVNPEYTGDPNLPDIHFTVTRLENGDPREVADQYGMNQTEITNWGNMKRDVRYFADGENVPEEVNDGDL